MEIKADLRERLRYALDNLFSRGAGTMILSLAVLSLGVVLVASLILLAGRITPAGSDQELSFFEAFWLSLMRTLDPGTMGGDEGWAFRMVMLGVTIGGIFVISTLIGVLSNGIDAKLEELRKGRSRVIESGHTVILGWSEQIFTILSELVIANENQPKSCIVILGDHDKVEMEDEIRAKVGNCGRTRIVCRTGSPMDMVDLEIASLNSARAIIVLAPETDDPDSEVIKTILAIANHPRRRAQPYHIVAELRDPKNTDVARVVGGDEVEWIQVGRFIGRIIAQTCRQSGLSVVYTELLDFSGDEIYFHEEAALHGKRFGDALLAYEKNAVMGIAPPDGEPALNPPMDTILQPGDELILIAEDDDKIFLSSSQAVKIQEAEIAGGQMKAPAPERTLVLGWNWRATGILMELDHYVAPGSEALVVADSEGVEGQLEACRSELKRQKVEFRPGDTTDRRLLDSLDLERFDHIILLCYDNLSVQQADARTLITLLHLRDISERSGRNFSIVSEILDVRNRSLADITRADDFIVSDKLVSLRMAQVAENKRLNSVFVDLFDPEGSEVYLKPAGMYVRPGAEVDFFTVVEAARRRGEVAIGYRRQALAQDAGQAYGVVLNPDKAERVSYREEDRIIVLAES